MSFMARNVRTVRRLRDRREERFGDRRGDRRAERRDLGDRRQERRDRVLTGDCRRGMTF